MVDATMSPSQWLRNQGQTFLDNIDDVRISSVYAGPTGAFEDNIL